eukprot:530417_1
MNCTQMNGNSTNIPQYLISLNNTVITHYAPTNKTHTQCQKKKETHGVKISHQKEGNKAKYFLSNEIKGSRRPFNALRFDILAPKTLEGLLLKSSTVYIGETASPQQIEMIYSLYNRYIDRSNEYVTYGDEYKLKRNSKYMNTLHGEYQTDKVNKRATCHTCANHNHCEAHADA